MTVRELINELEKIPNQNLPVRMMYDEFYNDDECMGLCTEEREIDSIFVYKDALTRPTVYICED